MKLYLIIIITTLMPALSYGLNKSHIECPKDSILADSVLIINEKLERVFIKAVHKYKPERKKIILTFRYKYKLNDSLLTFSMDNGGDATYSLLVSSADIYGYFIIDSVLFIIKDDNLPKNIFLTSSNSKLLYTEKNNCTFLTTGSAQGIEGTYIIKTKGTKLKIRKENRFFINAWSLIMSYYYRLFSSE